MSLSVVLRRAISVLEGEGRRRYGDLIEELQIELGKLERRKEVREQKNDRRTALAGEKFLWPVRGADGATDLEMVIHKAEPGSQGAWWCIACGEVFENNLMKEMHCGKRRASPRKITNELGDSKARHVLAWFNFVTGRAEVP